MRVEIRRTDPRSPAALACVTAYHQELDQLRMLDYDPALNRLDIDSLQPPTGAIMLAWCGGRAVGCGAVVLQPHGMAEIKRMWVAPPARGQGIGGRLLAELEHWARAAGMTTMRLETRRELAAAVQLYRRSGYHEVEPFTQDAWIHHWFAKPLTSDVPAHDFGCQRP
jgi:GNAT superfamily N-acetyltransferase